MYLEVGIYHTVGPITLIKSIFTMNFFNLLIILVTVIQVALQFPNVIFYRSECYLENYQYLKNKIK